ncbi:MAG: TIM barrel protein [Solirubrobacteraceae bacterium]
MRDKTQTSQTHSLRVGDAIGADGVVLHTGSADRGHLGEAIERAGDIGDALRIRSLPAAHREHRGRWRNPGPLVRGVGGIDRGRWWGPAAQICLDSCHLFASGYGIRTPEAPADVLDVCDRVVGLDRLASLHVNDSMAGLGANRDRHAVLGEGEIGEQGLAVSCPSRDSRGCPACSKPDATVAPRPSRTSLLRSS